MKQFNTQQRLQQILDQRGLRQVDILNLAKPYCEEYKVKLNKSDLSQYISGKTEPNQDKLAILGMALDVNETWLMGYDVPPERNLSFVTCSICGLSYVNSVAEDIENHDDYHKAFLLAKEKFPELLNPDEAYEVIKKSWDILDFIETDTSERYKVCWGIIQYYFCRSLRGCRYNLNHVSFNDYAAMLLNQEHFKERFGVSYERLKKRYGTLPGIENGYTEYDPYKAILKLSDKNIKKGEENFNLSEDDEQKKLVIIGFDKLDKIDKGIILGEIRQMLRADKYKNTDL